MFFSAWLARTGIRPDPESFRLIKQRCFQVRQNCLRSSIQQDGAVADIEMKHSSCLSPQNHDCSSDAVKSAHKNNVKKKENLTQPNALFLRLKYTEGPDCITFHWRPTATDPEVTEALEKISTTESMMERYWTHDRLAAVVQQLF